LVSIFVAFLVLFVMLICLSGCEYKTFKGGGWKNKFDISNPNLELAGDSVTTANSSGWYSTMIEDFDSQDSIKNLWQPVENVLRNEEYWCDKMVNVKNGQVEILAEKLDNHVCDNCFDKSNYYTSGIITCRSENGKRVPTFEQAFGYFEAKVKFPNSDGMWSAFWLQTTSQGQIGNGGRDGAEIDIYESSFWNKKDYVGHCIHYDGYGSKHRAGQATHSVGKDLYDGYHTFGLKWTPNEYVFYVDGVAVWATDFGGVCQVPAYIMLTNEIRQKAKYGPYGQKLGEFTGGTFYIDYVKVYQNVNYLSHIRSAEDFK
ncbi:MAG: glycoside hydrolase family 16 protein, partial [Clostridia bacterium]|nr:glycoside hydrolase family 16 protein [Clostridia bacterium]